MLSEKIKSKVLNEKLKEILFDGSKFKTNNFDSISSNCPVYSINNFLYTYGYDNAIGYFFIIVNNEKEGFLFTRKTYKDIGTVTHDFIVATEDFIDIKEIFVLFDINLAKDSYIELLRSNNFADIPYSINAVFSRLYFGPRNNSYKKPKKAKILGLIIFNLFLTKNTNNEFSDVLNKYEENLIIMYKNGESNSQDINLIISIIIINHISYICENKININTIHNFILNYI
jgi:hypothetical protein